MVHLKKAGEELNTVQSMIANGYILTIEEVEMLSVLDSRLKEFRQKLIRQMREHNRPVKDIAHLFGLSSSRVSQICKPKGETMNTQLTTNEQKDQPVSACEEFLSLLTDHR